MLVKLDRSDSAAVTRTSCTDHPPVRALLQRGCRLSSSAVQCARSSEPRCTSSARAMTVPRRRQRHPQPERRVRQTGAGPAHPFDRLSGADERLKVWGAGGHDRHQACSRRSVFSSTCRCASP